MERIEEVSLQKAAERLKKVAKDGRISCAVARRIAEELNLGYKEVGELANREGIKIKDCELGCF
ncbi:MAG: hypothetical protein D6710_08660 [Nitrospirae bacterium]|nr:MAG: hypothetical protein D6710_08660 [Nitrospirota bacterium]